MRLPITSAAVGREEAAENDALPLAALVPLMTAGDLLHIVATLEALDTSGRVNDALLAREKGMTLAAHLGVQALFGRARLEGCATGADNRRVDIIGMNLRLHRVLGSFAVRDR